MQKTAYYITFMMASISVGVIVGILLDLINDPLELSKLWTFLFSIPLNLIFLALFASPIIQYMRQLTQALSRLNDGKSTKTLPKLHFGMLNGLTEQVNHLISNQQEFQAARGRLYEQISEVAAQEERKRLARDLHDSIKQQVFSISISAAAAHVHLDNNPTAAREALLDVKQSAQEAMVEMRALLQQLSPAPLEKAGLIEALREQSEAFAYRTGARIQTQFGELPDDELLPTGTQETIFRIAQEALSNIARHARAQNVTLSLEARDDETFVLYIKDDGQGFDIDAQPTGMGLGNIRSRAEQLNANINIKSEIGVGTTLEISVPFVEPEIEDIDMFEHYEEQGKQVIAQNWIWSGSVAAIIFSMVLLLSRFINHSDNFAPDRATQVILVVLLFIFFGAIPTAIVMYRRVVQGYKSIVEKAGYGSRTDYWLTRHRIMGLLVVAVCAAWFVPLLTINKGINNWIPILFCLAFFGFVGWFYRQMHDVYRSELQLMKPHARIEELNNRLGELRTSWVSIIFLIVVQAITINLDNEFVIPPQNGDHWMNLFLVTITVLLIFNQFGQMAVFRRWIQEAEQERALA